MSDPRQFKDAIYDQFARMGQAVASPRRLELLDLLCQGPRTVEVLSSQTNRSLANVPAHLHIPGALSIPLADLKKRLSAIPRSREVVACCRGPSCVLAIEAVTLLRARGYRAARMEEGIPEWRARGLPVEVSPQAAP